MITIAAMMGACDGDRGTGRTSAPRPSTRGGIGIIGSGGAASAPSGMRKDLPDSPSAPGFPSRAADLDALPGFQNPPPGYGEVPFWWWTGDPLDKRRLRWQIEELHKKGIAGVQVNYAHMDTPGWPTYPPEPEIFSQDWWEMWRFAAEECRKRGMGIGLSGYTIDWPRGNNLFNRIIYTDPEIQGREIVREAALRAETGQKIVHPLAADVIGIRAYPLSGGELRPGGIDLTASVTDGRLVWTAPAGTWEVWIFTAPRIEGTLSPVHPSAGKIVVEKFFQPFLKNATEDGEAGSAAAANLNDFFQDELKFGVGDVVWADDFAVEFKKRKGYDVFEALPALFADIGPTTAKARLDYLDVKTALSEERYFIPVFDWHNSRGMIYGCDPEGRGLEPGMYGDNFRIQRWYTAPGHDTPGGRADLIKGKVSSSIAALYGRPRVWLEGYHSLGWGAAPERLMYATSENFLYGCNLLNLHGLYYTTHGSFWEWAPPCYHFRMPYWDHLPTFLKYFERLSYLMSQGVSAADIAILYPVSPAQARMDGNASAAAAFDSGRELFSRGYDFLFMDDQSLERAEIRGGELDVSGMTFKVLILPSMKAVRWTTIQKAAEFKRRGGIVINVGALPEASDRAGSGDAQLESCVRELFGRTDGETGPAVTINAGISEARFAGRGSERDSVPMKNAGIDGEAPAGNDKAVDRESPSANPEAAVKEGGLGIVVQSAAELSGVIEKRIPRAVESVPPVRATRRKIGFRDVYMVMDAARGTQCVFNSKGLAELWDPWTGKNIPLEATAETTGGTRIRMPLDRDQAQVIVFTPAERTGIESRDPREREEEAGRGETWNDGREEGRKVNRLSLVERAGALPAPETTALGGDWEFELEPTMDNRWGDFRLPATERMIGAEARIFRYAEEKGSGDGLAGNWEAAGYDDSDWLRTTHGYGQKFWKLGPLPALSREETDAFENRLAAALRIDPKNPVEMAGKKYFWQPYDFSWRWGREGDPGHQGFHGLKEKVTDEFICLGNRVEGKNRFLYEEEAGGTRYYLWTSARAGRAGKARIEIGGIEPKRIYFKGKPLAETRAGIVLEAGPNPLLLRYDNPGRGYFVLVGASANPSEIRPEMDEEVTHENRKAQAETKAGVGSRIGAGFEADVASKKEESVGNENGAVAGAASDQSPARTPLSMKWYDETGLVPFDVRASETEPAGWYRFVAPPGLRKMVVRACGRIRIWIDGREATVREIPVDSAASGGRGLGLPTRDKRESSTGGKMGGAANTSVEKNESVWNAAIDTSRADAATSGGTRRFEILATLVPTRKSSVAVRVEQDRGAYGGAALPEPVLLECGPGLAEAGDWSQGSVLENYSGGAWYRKTMRLNREQAGAGILLDLGDVVATAEVRVNGKTAAVLVCPPWKADLTGLARAGENRLEVLVYNTLANHYLTIPSRYKSETLRSGLLGPVKLSFWPSARS